MMNKAARSAFLRANSALYQMARPLIFLMPAQKAHDRAIWLLEFLDRSRLCQALLRGISGAAFQAQPINAGGVTFDHPLILGAGFVKGRGFADEASALAAARRGDNIIPGWRSMPQLVGAVEFGSFTRWPRMGNPGAVMWRHSESRSTQNRVGLRNPGAAAAAVFLSSRREELPRVFGINIAVSPGVSDSGQEEREILDSVEAFMTKRIYPTWLTLNLSCPNTQDDPGGNQTEEKARRLCGAVTTYLAARAPHPIPLWVKLGPDLADEQYRALLRAFAETGVRAVVATNTLPAPAPDDSSLTAGLGGGALHRRAVEVASMLVMEKSRHSYNIDIIGCGGVQNGETYRDFANRGVSVAQYYSALIYRGPLAAALIMNEA